MFDFRWCHDDIVFSIRAWSEFVLFAHVCPQFHWWSIRLSFYGSVWFCCLWMIDLFDLICFWTFIKAMNQKACHKATWYVLWVSPALNCATSFPPDHWAFNSIATIILHRRICKELLRHLFFTINFSPSRSSWSKCCPAAWRFLSTASKPWKLRTADIAAWCCLFREFQCGKMRKIFINVHKS